ncbi:putative alpha-xylosidase [Talaromyces proteolyticus]|uniref:alpha-glucosidase n=1 Tax=Talaromyces proteolyticus TaxID=1131652 RepID=A0AAD4KK44_9EURO|nr:putative alpha-xylosidase [Talaromyces proteolyticus]KAH8690286.1 putative alpha-xylosidase [Talaromyces proteolyticus]
MHRYTFNHDPRANTDAIVGGRSTDKYRFTVLADGLLRYEWAIDHQFEDRASVFAINRRLPVPEFRVKENDSSLQIITSRLHLTYNKQAFSSSGLHVVVKGNFHCHGSLWRYGEAYTDLGGTARTLDEANGRIPLESGIMARGGFTSVDDSESMLFDTDGWITVRAPGVGRVDGYLFAYGHDFREAIKTFYALSGPQPLLPRWAMGNWWSRYYAYHADEYLALVDRFHSEGIPLSVAVLDMDWHLVDDPRIAQAGVTGWTGYTWNKQLFPDPPAFMKKLHERGLHISLNDHPADGVQSFEDPYEEMAKVLNHDTSHGDPIPFDITNRAFLDAYFDILHRRFESEGIDLWWVDWQQGKHSRIPGVDPLWVLNHFQFLDSKQNGQLPLTFSRYAGPGSHRYPVGFSGDSIVTWESLQFQPEFTASASNIGFGWWSHDIGGHMHGVKDNELLVRWVQYGTFSPILRLHSSNNPWNIKEPWNLPVQYKSVMSEFLRLRHRLIPYLYTMNVRAAVEGLPLVQPMYWAYAEREEAYEFPNQYLFGSELMVVPVTSPENPTSRQALTRAWLPPGRRQVDISTGIVYNSDRLLWLSRKLSEFPVFASEGAIIPLDVASEPGNNCKNPDGIEILLIVGADGYFELVEDNGKGQTADDVHFLRTPIRFEQNSGQVTIGPTVSSPTFGLNKTNTRDWTIRLIGRYSSSVSPWFSVGQGPEIQISPEPVDNGLVLKLGTHQITESLVVSVGDADPQLDTFNPHDRIMTFLREAHIELDLKARIRSTIDREIPLVVIVGELHALGLDDVVLYPLLETLLADSRTLATRDYNSTC